MHNAICRSSGLADVRDDRFTDPLEDRQFAHDLLDSMHVPVAPGSSCSTPYRDHFRMTTLPDPETLSEVFGRIDSLLDQHR